MEVFSLWKMLGGENGEGGRGRVENFRCQGVENFRCQGDPRGSNCSTAISLLYSEARQLEERGGKMMAKD